MATALSLDDGSSSIWVWYLDGASRERRWHLARVVDVAGDARRPTPLAAAIALAVDDRMLYVACAGAGRLLQYDVGDPFAPRLAGRVELDGVEVDPGDQVRLHDAPTHIPFGTQRRYASRATFKAGELNRDFVAVVRFQGPRANGMPEMHSLTPLLGMLQNQGRRVALVTDGRLSGASGKIPSAIHVTPEAQQGGPRARVRDGLPTRRAVVPAEHHRQGHPGCRDRKQPQDER